MTSPEEVFAECLRKGATRLEIGHIILELATGKITREITLDEISLGFFEFPGDQIDWKIVMGAIK